MNLKTWWEQTVSLIVAHPSTRELWSWKPAAKVFPAGDGLTCRLLGLRVWKWSLLIRLSPIEVAP